MRQALGQKVSIARVDRGAVVRYGRWLLMRLPCSAALMRPLCVRPECPAFLYPGVRAAGYSSQTHGGAGSRVARLRGLGRGHSVPQMGPGGWLYLCGRCVAEAA